MKNLSVLVKVASDEINFELKNNIKTSEIFYGFASIVLGGIKNLFEGL